MLHGDCLRSDILNLIMGAHMDLLGTPNQCMGLIYGVAVSMRGKY